MSGALLAAFFTLGRIHDWNWQFVQEMIKEVNQQHVILNLANWGAVALYFLVAPVIAMAFVKHKG